MVGTSPMLAPRRRCSASARRTSSIESITATRATVLPEALWELPISHLLGVSSGGFRNRFSQLRITLRKRRRGVFCQPQRVIADQHLAVAMRPSADADRGNAQLRGYGAGQFGWNRFQHDRENARFFQRLGVLDQALRI